MKVYPKDLERALRGELKPLYLVTGDELVQMRDISGKIRAHAASKGFRERQVRVIEPGFDWNGLPSLCGPSLFGDPPLLDLRLLHGKPDTTARNFLRDWCEHPPGDSVLLLQTPRLDNRDLNAAWARAVDRAGVIVRVMPLDETETRRWLQRALRSRGLVLAAREQEFFLSCVEGNLLAAEQELDKIEILRGPGEVDLASLQELLGADARYGAVDLAQAMLEGRPARIASITRYMEREGIAPMAAYGYLIREVRQLLALGVQPQGFERLFPFSRRDAMKRLLARFPQKHFQALLQKFLSLERTLKGRGYEHPWDALTDACLACTDQDPIAGRHVA